MVVCVTVRVRRQDSTVIPKELIPAEELRALEAKLKPSVESREADDASQVPLPTGAARSESAHHALKRRIVLL